MVQIPWRVWYGDEQLTLDFPPAWQVQAYWPADAPRMEEREIEAAFDNPMGTPTIARLAQGKRRVSIAVDDISRPTPVAHLMPGLMRRLERGGVDLDNVHVVMGTGMHRPMVKDEIIKKIGRAAAERLDVHNNHPYDNVMDLGTSERGTPVRICRFFAEADVKIGIGCILPHGGPGFGGGAKIILPGVASIETIASMHVPGRLKTGILDVENNELRAEIEHIARDVVGLDCIINAVINTRREIVGLFIGDVVRAHRAGVQLAQQVYATPMPAEPVEIVICNAYPKDTEFLQNGNALNILASAKRPVVKEGGSIVIITASPEGRGYHGIYGPGMRYDPLREEESWRGRRLIRYGAALVYFSPNLTPADARHDAVFQRWPDLIQYLHRLHGSRASVAVFPCGSMQIAAASNT